MFEIITEGRLNSCLAPAGPCTCRVSLFATTGTLALIAGLTQWVVGYRYSMAAFSDALHALSDSLADYLIMFLEQKVGNKPFRAKKLRALGDKAIAILLALGAAVIGFEAYDRWSGCGYLVWLPAVIVVGIFGLAIDLIRFNMLSKARGHSNSSNLEGLILHARSDAQHSGIISVVALLAMLGVFFELERGLYEFLVRLTDYLASLGLAGYMMLILSPRIWSGKGCGCVTETPADDAVTHKHGAACKHE